MPSAFRENPDLEVELHEDPQFQSALAKHAEEGARQARIVAHRIMPAGRGVNIAVVKKGGSVLIANFDHGAHLDEFGSANNPPYAPLRRGAKAAGLRFKESDRR